MTFEFTDNSEEFISAMRRQGVNGLEECGLVGDGHAKKLCTVDTGNLRNSITHAVNEPELKVYIGSNAEHAVYVECGTGKYYPGGRDTPWTYKDAKGNWHMTNGQRAQPYVKPAVADHAGEYQGILERRLKD